MRLEAVQALGGQPTEAAVNVLAHLLDDPTDKVRVAAREAMLALATDPAAGSAVRAGAIRMAASGQWRGVEQAVMILGVLKEQSAARQVTELLAFNRPEVRIAAVIAIRRIGIAGAPSGAAAAHGSNRNPTERQE